MKCTEIPEMYIFFNPINSFLSNNTRVIKHRNMHYKLDVHLQTKITHVRKIQFI